MRTRREFIKQVGGSTVGGLLLRGLPLGLGAALLTRPRRAYAIPVFVADYTFPDPNTEDGGPDPAVWATEAVGTVPVQGAPGLGWGISDPDSVSQLLYSHLTPFLSANPADPAFANTATFRSTVVTSAIPDNSGAFADNVVGWRMILDDGQQRVELALGRDPVTKARLVRLIDAAAAPAIPFPWDNDFPNTYEIARQSNGDFVVTLTNGDSSAPNGTVTQSFPAGQTASSDGAPRFAWGVGLTGGGSSFWQSAHAEVHSPAVPFAAFDVKVEVELRPLTNHDTFEIKGSFTLGDASNGIHILTEVLRLQLSGGTGGFSATIPAGSFRQDKKGRFKFETTIDGAILEIVIQPLGDNSYELKAEGDGFDLGDIQNPLTVKLTIGDDSGSASVEAEFE